MVKIIDALKELGKKLNTSGTAPAGTKTADVILNIADAFDISGASVASITLYTSEGAVTGGVATLTDGTDITITVTTEPAE